MYLSPVNRKELGDGCESPHDVCSSLPCRKVFPQVWMFIFSLLILFSTGASHAAFLNDIAQELKTGNFQAPVANQRPTTTTLYNKVGKPIAVQDARGSWSRSFYDRAYRVIFTRINPSTGSPSAAPDPGTNNAFDIVTQTVLDKNGNPLAVTDGNGNITRNAFDALNRQITTAVNPTTGNPTDPSGNGYTASTYQLAAGIAGDIVTTTLYDDAGNVVRISDGQGRTLDYRYDGLKRKTHTIWDIGTALPRTEILAYNGVLQTSRTDANGRVTNYGYDGLHRLTSITYPSRTQDNRTNSYDLANNLQSVTYPNESAANKLRRQCSSAYDALNRVISETSNEVETTTSFDKAGNTLTKTYGQTNRTITSQYDALNRLTQCTEGTRITYYTFDLNGNITRKTLPNGQYTDKIFDRLNRTVKSLTKTLLGVLLVSTDSTAAVAPYSSGYDNMGSLLKTTEQYAHASVKNRTLTNSYDKTYRLTQEILDQSGTGGTVQTTAYQYDRSNNRHRKTVTVGSTVTEDYEHNYGDGDNGANSHQLKSFGPWGGAATHTFTYDANGSRLTMATAGRTDTYLYDDEKRLVSLDYQTDADANKRGSHIYQYDHRTRRVTRNESAITGGTDNRLVFADGLSVQEHGASITSSPVVEYIRGSDYGGGMGGVLYTLRSGTPRYNAYNYRGDVTTTTDSNAAINWQAAYEAFGKRTQEQGTNPERQRANTKDEDPTGLLNEGMRYRDLLTGAFISRDPLGPVDGPNEYTYVRQTPWSSFDPLGLKMPDHDAEPSFIESETSNGSKAYNLAMPLKEGDGKGGWKSAGHFVVGGQMGANSARKIVTDSKARRKAYSNAFKRMTLDEVAASHEQTALDWAEALPSGKVAYHTAKGEYGKASLYFARDVGISLIGGKLVQYGARGASVGFMAAATPGMRIAQARSVHAVGSMLRGGQITAGSMASATSDSLVSSVTPRSAWNNGWRTADGKFASPNGAGRSGAAAEQSVWAAVSQKPGWSVIQGNVGVKNASGQLRYYDGVAVSPRGRVIGLEVKSGSAVKTPAQRIFDSGVNTYNPAVGVGRHAGLPPVGGTLQIRR